jgi:hypothetical protein
MSNSAGVVDIACTRRSHAGRKADMRAYDRLPSEVRALLREASCDRCAACIAVLLRQHGLRAVALWLADAGHRQSSG